MVAALKGVSNNDPSVGAAEHFEICSHGEAAGNEPVTGGTEKIHLSSSLMLNCSTVGVPGVRPVGFEGDTSTPPDITYYSRFTGKVNIFFQIFQNFLLCAFGDLIQFGHLFFVYFF